MANEIIRSSKDGTVIEFSDDLHDAIATVAQGMIPSVRRIVIGNGPASFGDGVLSIHIDGDPINVGVTELEFNTTKVTAVSLADLSDGTERMGHRPQSGKGGVVVVLIMHLDCPDSTLARAGITATEAITAAVQDLGLAYDSMTVSGSARQDIVVVRDRGSDLFLRGAGKHSKLGELIGRATIDSVKESAARNGTDIGSRRSVLAMLSSYGYGAERLSEMAGRRISASGRDSDPKTVATVSAVLHLYNECRWGLVSEEIATKVGTAAIASGIGEPVVGKDQLETLALTAIKHVFNRCYMPCDGTRSEVLRINYKSELL